jgi:uncharacterized protein (UPF0128 family)
MFGVRKGDDVKEQMNDIIVSCGWSNEENKMKAKDAEKWLYDLVGKLDGATSFDNFIRFVTQASKEGFTVVPYSEIEKKGKKIPEKGAMVFGQFPGDDGELVEVASNPILCC